MLVPRRHLNFSRVMCTPNSQSFNLTKKWSVYSTDYECPLRPSEIENKWHMMKNQNSLYFAQPMAGLETCWDFFVEKSYKPAKNLQNRWDPHVSSKTRKINVTYSLSETSH